MISRSSISSPVTLLTVATLSPLSWLSSWRLSGPSKKSFESNADRLRRRRSRTVLRLVSIECQSVPGSHYDRTAVARGVADGDRRLSLDYSMPYELNVRH